MKNPEGTSYLIAKIRIYSPPDQEQCFLSLFLLSVILEVLKQCKKEEKSIKASQVRKVEANLFLFADNMIINRQKFYGH